ncbi:hypothetical protein J3R30DRAFT_3753911 [Lentinula aciculospora]|uniref:Uncharacterized protein n=1 Tax=Lentinula aciculospora TaxID=153920 RepID=A0A9W9DMB7_9AGAR|nr:hypothetical protein J3R30DRAFT_3753911 [Lentinula aciculospora]
MFIAVLAVGAASSVVAAPISTSSTSTASNGTPTGITVTAPNPASGSASSSTLTSGSIPPFPLDSPSGASSVYVRDEDERKPQQSNTRTDDQTTVMSSQVPKKPLYGQPDHPRGSRVWFAKLKGPESTESSARSEPDKSTVVKDKDGGRAQRS